MRYLCLVYQDEGRLAALSDREYDALVREAVAFDDELRAGGYYVDSSPLQPTYAATTVRVGHGALSIADGPFASTKEQVVGYYVIDARDLNEAIRMAARMPPGRLGSVEVRPLKECAPPL